MPLFCLPTNRTPSHKTNVDMDGSSHRTYTYQPSANSYYAVSSGSCSTGSLGVRHQLVMQSLFGAKHRLLQRIHVCTGTKTLIPFNKSVFALAPSCAASTIDLGSRSDGRSCGFLVQSLPSCSAGLSCLALDPSRHYRLLRVAFMGPIFGAITAN